MLSAMRYSSVSTPAPVTAAPLRCLVVDGDAAAAAALAACVQQTPSLALAGSYTRPAQALAHLRTQPVDVLFLPIELPLLAGLKLLQRNGPAVVLTSTYPDYSLQSYDAYGVVDYLRKPFCPARFQQIAARLHSQRLAVAPLPSRGPLTQPQTDSLYFWANQQLVQVRTADLLYAEDLGGCTRLQTLHQELVLETPFAKLADQLPEPQFLRVNPTCTVALRHATAVAGNALAVAGRRIAVGAALQDEVLARVFQTSVWSA
jgi:DNA-binding LytR/AlgR family response regulator